MKFLKAFAALCGLAVALSFACIQLAPAATTAFVVGLKRRVGGVERRTVTLEDGLQYVLLEGGQGETLVLLHGFGADKDNFVEVAPYLTGDFHVIAPDHIGFGESSKPRDADYDPVAQARRLHELMALLGVERFHLGGSSMGGHIALTYASLYPEQVQSLWLLDPGGVWSAPESELRRTVRETGKNPLMARTPEEFRGVFSFVMSRPPFVPDFVLDVMAQNRIDNFELEERVFAHASADSVEERARGLPAPTLLVWGEEDRVLSPKSVDVLEGLLPNIEVIVMPGIGHLPMLEAPQQTAADLKAFLRGLEKQNLTTARAP